jgi:DNA polymerase-3 subunit alpha
MSGHPLDDYRLEIDAFCKNSVADIREENIKHKLGHQVSVAGIVTNSIERTTKNNTLFGIFTIEDDNDSVQLTLFSDDYLKFRHLLIPGMSLLLTGSVQRRFRDSPQIELKVSNVVLLAETIDKLTKNITIELSASDIDPILVSMLNEAIASSRGGTQLHVKIVDDLNRITLNLPSRLRVNPRKFTQQMKTFNGVKVSLVG